MWEVDVDDRPRERLFREGARRLSDAELVALVLRNGRPGQSALELARVLLGTQRDLTGLAAARSDVLADFVGMGPAKAAAVAAAFELGRRTTEVAEAVPLRRAEDVVAVARRERARVPGDALLLLLADFANRVRWTVLLATGLLGRATGTVGRVLDTVRAHGAESFALARLVPGAVEVLPVDEELVRRLRTASRAADLRFLDYVVVGEADWRGVVAEPPLVPDHLPPGGLPARGYDVRAGPL
ncbi:MAG TPA: UPF0758 domain-containing protein [Mycobacteriales bacterium]|jgi:DNA repair protein RadC|nr:UPF0758 domain-containing protein [Mycobacteriales bacterium]